MHFKLIKQELFPLLQNAINFTSVKNTNTILQNIYISAEPDKITFNTNNVISGFSATLEAPVESTGVTTVLCKKLFDIVKEFPDSAIIDFDFDGSRLKITSGKANFNLATMDPELFPTMSEITPEYTLNISGSDLINVIDKTVFCVANNASKIEFTGLHFKVYGNKLELYSADFQRIASAVTTLPDEHADEFIINIPKKTITDISRVLSRQLDVEIATDLKQLMITTGNIKMFSRLIEKSIKSIGSLFSSEYPIEIVVNKDFVIDVLKKVMAIANEFTHAVVMSVTGNNMTIYSIETEYGQAVDSIDNVSHSGDDIDIVVNARIFYEILLHIDSTEVIFKISGRRNPMVILPASGSYKYLLVPLSVNFA